jgi:hypothetical protein
VKTTPSLGDAHQKALEYVLQYFYTERQIRSRLGGKRSRWWYYKERIRAKSGRRIAGEWWYFRDLADEFLNSIGP